MVAREDWALSAVAVCRSSLCESATRILSVKVAHIRKRSGEFVGWMMRWPARPSLLGWGYKSMHQAGRMRQVLPWIWSCKSTGRSNLPLRLTCVVRAGPQFPCRDLPTTWALTMSDRRALKKFAQRYESPSVRSGGCGFADRAAGRLTGQAFGMVDVWQGERLAWRTFGGVNGWRVVNARLAYLCAGGSDLEGVASSKNWNGDVPPCD